MLGLWGLGSWCGCVAWVKESEVRDDARAHVSVRWEVPELRFQGLFQWECYAFFLKTPFGFRVPYLGKTDSREMGYEAIVIVQARDNSSWERWSSKMEVEKWLIGSIISRCKRKAWSRMIITFLAWTKRWIKLPFYKVRTSSEEAGLREDSQEFGFAYDQFEMSIRNPNGIVNTGVWHSRRGIQAGEVMLVLPEYICNSNS